jgi:hypothetical protein
MAEAVRRSHAMETDSYIVNWWCCLQKARELHYGRTRRVHFPSLAYLPRGLNMLPATLVTKRRGTRRSPWVPR